MTAISSNNSPLTPEAQAELDRHRGRFVPWVIIAFFLSFVVVLSVMTTIAVTHRASEVTAEAYDKGRAYNQTLQAAQAAARLGWQFSPTWKAGQLDLTIKDRNGQPVRAESVRVWFVNSADGQLDRAADMTATASGYVSHIRLPRGLWHVHVTAEQAGQQAQAVFDQEIVK